MSPFLQNEPNSKSAFQRWLPSLEFIDENAGCHRGQIEGAAQEAHVIARRQAPIAIMLQLVGWCGVSARIVR
jgi:hypothetical protein